MKYSNTIVINGKFLEQKLSGVQRFAYEVIKELDNNASNSRFRFILAISKKAQISNIPSLKNIIIKQIGKTGGIFWEQFTLANFIRKNNAVGLHFCNSIPFFAPKGFVTIHDISHKVNPQYIDSFKLWLKTRWHLLQFRISTRHSLGIFTVSEFSKSQICSVYHIPEKKVRVVYCGWQHFIKDKASTDIQKFPFLKKWRILLQYGKYGSKQKLQVD